MALLLSLRRALGLQRLQDFGNGTVDHTSRCTPTCESWPPWLPFEAGILCVGSYSRVGTFVETCPSFVAADVKEPWHRPNRTLPIPSTVLQISFQLSSCGCSVYMTSPLRLRKSVLHTFREQSKAILRRGIPQTISPMIEYETTMPRFSTLFMISSLCLATSRGRNIPISRARKKWNWNSLTQQFWSNIHCWCPSANSLLKTVKKKREGRRQHHRKAHHPLDASYQDVEWKNCSIECRAY